MPTRVDPHVKILDEGVARRAKARGIDVLVYAPHFTRLPTIRERAARFSDDDLLVVPARELFTGSFRNRKHVLALDLDSPIPDFLTFEATLSELDHQNAVTLAPHPEFATVSVDVIDLRRHPDRFCGVEVYNPKHLAKHNRRAREIARETGLAPFGSSYAHLTPTLGEVWTEFETDIDSAGDLHEALRTGAPRRVIHRSGRSHELRCRTEFAHLAWENSWKKVDRLVLSGMEPTHPYHPAYEGRFDAASVY
ncbi:PHP-associated domain-containing protein [Halalkalicoccus subterraneus]|uniref:PHP-associated domain-containing protein n=1 Tax=Halalkalicoccus subterraneus TaxID=2675002 RepID=UPI000EFDA86D|nr:PHP-associated domain-containing protein [Halalkalicoccus subterraneus]